MVLGILGLVVCGVLAPIAYFKSKKVLEEIDANPAAYSNRGTVNIAKILGLIGTILLAVGIVVGIISLLGGLATGLNS